MLIPELIYIETTNICNAKCIMCPHVKMKRPQGFMSQQMFKKAILDLRHDNNLVESLSQNARRKAETWDWVVVRKKWLNLLSDQNLLG